MLKLEPIPFQADITDPLYSGEDCQVLLKMWADYYPKTGYHPPWTGYFTLINDIIVGSCAFTGPPVNNKVEISYWTFKEHEGQGISTWAASALVSIAKQTDKNLTVFAKTEPKHNASTKILQRNGFEFTGIVQDHEIGDAWEWTLPSDKSEP